jgi:membrane associated rhomboid family serine protease
MFGESCRHAAAVASSQRYSLANKNDRPTRKVLIPVKPPHVPIFNTSPMVTRLVIACVIIHLVVVLLPVQVAYELIERFAFISARYTFLGAWQFDIPAFVMGPFTHLFLHGGFVHLLLNMAMLLAFGTPIERRLTSVAFIILYIVSGLAGAVLFAAFHPNSMVPLLGASGAISGMVGAVGRISLSGQSGNGMPFRTRSTALTFVILWLVFNFVFGVVGLALFGMEGDVAWEAHLGGFIAGFALVGFFSRRTATQTGL